ncbi:MAG TPA: RNA 2',3'-cyclic phosphodiesterase [Rubrivivax sp.]|nr:RNA 2',3'-cyclic phosphodiesterase [Rubrivivax sp.]HRY86286.1 RNA 2',3'-cyclic phosphodiesterase [Rubrivivax sp.]HRZ60099.1 RNA 2',3'-cyclic phosphodiesterase [Rubrivivax sp.]
MNAPGARSQRLFLALWPGARVRAALARRRDRFSWPTGAAPVPDERLHLTLHFIGEVAAARVPALADALRAPAPRFELVLDSVAVWRGGLAVLRPSTLPDELLALHAALGAALHAAGLPVETRPFRPHVTLARRAAGAAHAGAAPPVHWPVAGYALVRSHLGMQPAYEPLWHRRAD